MMKLAINKKTLVQSLKVGGLVAGGVVAAKAGGALLRKVDAVAAFAAKSPARAAVVDAAGGLLLSGLVIAGLAAAGKSKIAAQTAPFLMGGAVMAALGPVVVDKVVAKAEEMVAAIGKAKPSGRVIRLAAPAAGGDFPGGLAPRRLAGVALGGNVPGGLFAGRRGGVAVGGRAVM